MNVNLSCEMRNRALQAGRKGASPHVVCGTTDGPGQGLLCLEHRSSVPTVPHEVRVLPSGCAEQKCAQFVVCVGLLVVVIPVAVERTLIAQCCPPECCSLQGCDRPQAAALRR